MVLRPTPTQSREAGGEAPRGGKAPRPLQAGAGRARARASAPRGPADARVQATPRPRARSHAAAAPGSRHPRALSAGPTRVPRGCGQCTGRAEWKEGPRHGGRHHSLLSPFAVPCRPFHCCPFSGPRGAFPATDGGRAPRSSVARKASLSSRWGGARRGPIASPPTIATQKESPVPLRSGERSSVRVRGRVRGRVRVSAVRAQGRAGQGRRRYRKLLCKHIVFSLEM